MEPWEALDLDDSDLPSILRPCKRHQSQQSQIPPVSLSNPNFSSQHCAPTSHPPADNQSPPFRCPIPGPAGAMQAVMGRVCQRNEDFSRNRDAKISTQDYIKMVEEDDAEEFMSDHWLSALDFLSREGVRRTTSLNDIKNCANFEKLDMVVAMIKCCTPNGLGDLTVVLKDRTDTISASIHRKVLTEGEYGKLIAVGSVLILQQVSVFSSLNKSFYLNISLRNVVKIVPKDAGREIYSVSTAKDDAPERHKSLKIPEQVSSGSGRTTKASQLIFNINVTPPVQKHFGEENSSSGIQINADQNSNMYASLQHRFERDHAGSNIMKEPIETDLVSSSQEASAEKTASISGCIQPDVDLRDENIAENLGDERLSAAQVEIQSTSAILFEVLEKEDLGREKSIETQQVKLNAIGSERLNRHAGETNVFEKINNLTPSKVSLQQWTDDQLDILDMDD
ncbi:hypothetical protein V2J09_005737 [Rumex salicifolius]